MKLPKHLNRFEIPFGDDASKPQPAASKPTMNYSSPLPQPKYPATTTIEDMAKSFEQIFVSPLQHQFKQQMHSNQYINAHSNNNVPSSQKSQKSRKSQHEDVEFWKQLAFKCSMSGDFAPFWREVKSSDDWKNANAQQRHAMTMQLQQMIDQNNVMKQSMAMNQMQHNARMNNTMHNTFAEINDMNYCQLMNNSQWGDNQVHYSLNPDYKYDANPFGHN